MVLLSTKTMQEPNGIFSGYSTSEYEPTLHTSLPFLYTGSNAKLQKKILRVFSQSKVLHLQGKKGLQLYKLHSLCDILRSY